ncbi:hypothetical protein KM043_006621 [Ampulex compressa]|nr:hypothetical protein KM043_006621 [Ampulex compressa]
MFTYWAPIENGEGSIENRFGNYPNVAETSNGNPGIPPKILEEREQAERAPNQTLRNEFFGLSQKSEVGEELPRYYTTLYSRAVISSNPAAPRLCDPRSVQSDELHFWQWRWA